MAIEKSYWGYNVDGHNVYVNDEIWRHTVMRIKNAEAAAREKAEKHMNDLKWINKNGTTNFDKEFLKLMVQRLKKITNMQKVYYAMAVLNEYGYTDVVNVYEGKVLMDHMLMMHEQSKW
jgi:hypothetical protein